MVMVDDSAKIYIGRHRSGQSSGGLDLSFDEEWFKNLNITEKVEVFLWLQEALTTCKKLEDECK